MYIGGYNNKERMDTIQKSGRLQTGMECRLVRPAVAA